MANRLARETSPYLRQHADNPVDWYPWGDEAFAAAAERDVPVLLSVGYSSCHWCHVMAHESFEDPDTAALMNDRFVNVKVDREERPDVDAVYMEATQAMTGQGGWPMTVFMTPAGEPFFCGTYYPRVGRAGMPAFGDLCRAIDDAWRDRRMEVTEQAGALTTHLRASVELPADTAPVGPEVLDAAVETMLAAHDARWGGFGRAPKFPQSMSIDVLLRHARRRGSAPALDAAVRSLDAMAAGGIYDHLGGGFARYSTDDRWLVPHFEKMLYDNALLIRPYLHAWMLTGERRHLEVVEQTLEYLARDLRHPAGGFFSAEDADSPTPDGHHEEGWFATWTLTEVRDALGDESEAEVIVGWYGMTAEGNFEGRNIPHRPVGEFERPPEVEVLRRRLADARSHRPRPGLDDKILTEWNGLLLGSLAEAAAATGREDWEELAVGLGTFLVTHLRRADGRWLRSWQEEGGARHLAYAADHAVVVDGFTRLYELTGEPRWLTVAGDAAEVLLDRFWDEDGGGFFTTADDAEVLLTRPKDLQDHATPSAQSTAAVALRRLAPLATDPRFEETADRLVGMLGPLLDRHPLAFAQMAVAVELTGGLREVVVAGDRPDLVEVVQRGWRPDAVLSWGEPLPGPLWEGRTDGRAYVCRHFTCGLPATTPAELDAQLAAPLT